MKIAIAANAAWNLVNFRMGVIRALVAQGHDVVAIVPEDPECRATLEAAGCRMVALPIDSATVSPLHDLALVRRYLAVLRRERPAAMLGYTIKPNVYGSFAAALLRIPTLNNISGLGTGFMRKGLLNRIVRGLYITGLARAHTVFFQNADDRDLFIGQRLVRPKQTVLLPGSGIDLGHFKPKPPRPAGEPLRFLLIARMLWDKGVGEYVEAARAVKRDHPDVRFGLLGGMAVNNRTAVPAETIRGWEAEGAVVHDGAVGDVRPAIAAADVIVLPSYREGTSRVLLEASALARPMITTDVPGCRDVVEDGVSGLLCQVRDAGSLATAMRRMIALAPEQRNAMGAAARARVERDFAEERVVEIYLERLRLATAARA